MEKIELINLSKNFGDKKIFSIDNLIIQSGQKIGIVGRNGVGKSTLLNIIAGNEKQDTGKVVINGKVSYIKQLDDLANQDIYLSGGEVMINNINKAFNENSNILLADEPSTNLDMFSIEYLIKKLREYKGIVLLISHDRNILDLVCSSIIEIENGEVFQYKGNYTSYRKQKEEKENRNKFEYLEYLKEKKRLEKALVNSKETARTMKKTPKRMGNSEARLHKRESQEIREKLEGHSNAIKTRLDKLERKEKVFEQQKIIFKVLNENVIKSKYVLKCEKYSLKRGKKILLDNINMYIYSNKKTGIIGKNGVGKTTLIKEIIDNNNKFIVNPKIKIGYFSQNLDILKFNESVIQNILTTSIQDEVTVRNILGNLDIKGDMVYNKIVDLSGGEKVKVLLAKLLTSDANFLILDEPTNFLDLESIEALERLIKQYRGTVLMISHDRNFIDNTCDNIILIKDRKIIQFDGNYTEYLSYEKNKKNITSNEKILLEFKISKLDSLIAVSKDENQKRELVKERDELLRNI